MGEIDQTGAESQQVNCGNNQGANHKIMALGWQIGTRHLFYLTAMIAVGFAAVYREAANIAMATVFCVVSIFGISVMLMVSATHLKRVISAAIDQRSLTPLVSRIKWLMLDTAIVVWVLAAIATANHILEKAETDGPKWLLLTASLLIPAGLFAFSYFRKLQTRPIDSE